MHSNKILALIGLVFSYGSFIPSYTRTISSYDTPYTTEHMGYGSQFDRISGTGHFGSINPYGPDVRSRFAIAESIMDTGNRLGLGFSKSSSFSDYPSSRSNGTVSTYGSSRFSEYDAPYGESEYGFGTGTNRISKYRDRENIYSIHPELKRRYSEYRPDIRY